MKTSPRLSWWLGVLLCALLGSAAAQAQELRIGYVNTDRIFKESTTSKAAQAKLEQEFAKRQKDLEERGAQLKAFADKFDREGPTLSEAQRLARQKEWGEMNRDFERRKREFQEDVNARKSEEFQQVLERANRVVRQIAESEKLSVVLQEAVYVDPKYDITEKVIKALSAPAPAGK
jgi:outer membrane protein